MGRSEEGRKEKGKGKGKRRVEVPPFIDPRYTPLGVQ